MAYTPIDKSDDYFNTVLYTGNGYPTSNTQSITGVGFQPDFIWIKDRDTSQHHRLADVVRGVKKNLKSDQTDAENTTNSTNGLQSFDSDGFTLTQDSSDHGYNANGSSQVSWNWLADNTSGSSNTDGSITSTVSANTTSGFSIVSYTGTGANATVGHGLGVAPKMVICKGRSFSSSAHWLTYHEAMGNTSAMKLNLDTAKETTSFYWNDTSPTSSTFSLGASTEANTSSATFIAYCFAEIKGFSKFNSYTGNGSSDGVFVYTGFKPAWVMIKKSSGVNEWGIWDNKRSTFNVTNDIIYANLTNAEASNNANGLDFVSNGFKIRASGDLFNASGGTYIYMAFAENPFVTSTGIPATAR